MDKRSWWKKRLELGVEQAMLRRNGFTDDGAEPAVDDEWSRGELVTIVEDITVRPLYLHVSASGKSWGTAPGKGTTDTGWKWTYGDPNSDFVLANENEDWMGMIDTGTTTDTVRYVEWIVDGTHDSPPPVPEHLLTYLEKQPW